MKNRGVFTKASSRFVKKEEALNKSSFRAPLRSGFTILELAVTVIIIAVIAVVALPMYKHAILKSRFSTVMPMAKAVADAQEIYYLGNNQYALGKEDLDIAPVEAENTQVSLSPAEEDEEYIYVAAHRTDIPNVRYIMYQKNSPKFASNIHCEADANDEDALWLCEKALHGTEVTGSLQGKQYKTFLLAGDLGGSSFKVCPENAVCNDEGNVTGCEGGYYQEEQTCKEEKTCDESKKTIRTSCAEDCGEEVKEGACNVKTGQWENYTVTQSCPVKPSEEESCDNGVSGKMRRTSQCQGNSWTEPNWNKSQCCDPNTAPDDEYICHDHDANTCGKKTRSVTCGTNGQWVADDNAWSGNCTTAETSSISCGDSYSNPTAEATQIATCQTDGMWKYGEYDYTACGCTTADKPTLTEQCGSDYSNSTANKTRTVSCNGTTWGTPGNWNTKACGCTMSTKPEDYTNGYCKGEAQGNEHYIYVCSSGKWKVQLDWSTCTPVEPGGTFNVTECFTSYTNPPCSGFTFDGTVCSVQQGKDKCVDNIYINGGGCSVYNNSQYSCIRGTYSGKNTYCYGVGVGNCTGGTFNNGAYCKAALATDSCTGATFESGSYCEVSGSSSSGSCANNDYKPGSWCQESNSGHCPAGTPTKDGKCWDGSGGKVAC